ncbi:Cyclin-like, partial [Sesbania bispinosa]
METRAAKKRANAAAPVLLGNRQVKRQRVVLGELPNLPNLILPQSPQKQKLRCRKYPQDKKPAPAGDTLDLKSENPVDHDSQIGESYASDIFTYLRIMEMEKKRRPIVDYMERVQRDTVTTSMRGILVDWLVEVAEEYKLLSDTLHLSVSYIDRFLSVNLVNKSRLQLLGVSSMLIASKYEEINPPNVEQFCNITDNTYTKSEVVKMEADILKSLKFEMGNPTVITFL